MTARVNLLPRAVEEREAGRRQQALVAAGFVVLLAVLGTLYVLQVGRVNDARDRLAGEQAELERLEGELAALQEFAELRERAEAAAAVLATAMAGEVSVAGILQDVAAVMPSDAALTSLSFTAAEQPEIEAFDLGGPSFGTLAGAGESLRGHAPGVERFLLEFDKVAAFFNVFFSTSSVDELGIASFSFEIDLGPEILTRRYEQGLPEGLR